MSTQHLPLVSVVMSVYNGEKYLRSAIDSILSQTFTNFEFIIIDDGSTDSTKAILDSYQDPRIKIISRANKGLVASLNEGISKARGKYIARMDADDISFPHRLEMQVNFLDSRAGVDLVAARVMLIEEDGSPSAIGWPEDEMANSPEVILQTMPMTNCIAHPSIMARANSMQVMPYNTDRPGGEDYDLWLRMLAAGYVIDKINQPLVKYRVHLNSITQIANQHSVQSKMIRLKRRFLLDQVSRMKWGKVQAAVAKNLLKDQLHHLATADDSRVMRLGAKSIIRAKQFTGRLVRFPSYIREKTNMKVPAIDTDGSQEQILVLLPWMTIGGADKVLFDICAGLSDSYHIHFITTEVGQSNDWHDKFASISPNVYHIAKDLRFGSNKVSYIKRYCRLNNIQTVLISNCLTGYEALPAIRETCPHIQVLDILHGQGGALEGGGYPKLMQPYEKLIDKHIVVTNYLKEYLKKEFGNNSKKIEVIHNGVDTQHFTAKKKTLGGAVSWVGRFSPEKHPEIFVELARAHPKIVFKMAGDGEMFGWLKDYAKSEKIKNLEFLGSVEDVRDLLNHSKLLVMTSEIEGLPIALLEAGSMGIPVIAPSVGGIPEYVVSGKNGYLINDYQAIKDYSSALSKVYDGRLGWNASQIRHKVERDFSLDKMLEAYEQAIG